jgi:hypothetical protein
VTRYDPISIWEMDMGDDSIDMVLSHIDVGYLVTQETTWRAISSRHCLAEHFEVRRVAPSEPRVVHDAEAARGVAAQVEFESRS